MTDKIYDIGVVGGGPSGMFAAGRAAKLGAKVILFEKNSTLGKKLSITGKGRCNLTNSNDLRDFIKNYGKNGPFLWQALSRFSNKDLMYFFNNLNVCVKIESDGRVFPVKEDATVVVNALEKFIKKYNVVIKLKSRVTGISLKSSDTTKEKTIFEIKTQENIKYLAEKVIVATGGMSYPYTGSTGDGYFFAESFGHTIIKPQPALVPLEVNESYIKYLNGLSLKNAKVSVIINDKIVKDIFGEMIFTHFGVSGPIILTLSGDIVEALNRNEKVSLSINFKPDLDHKTLEKSIICKFVDNPNKSFINTLKLILPYKITKIFAMLTEIDKDKKCNQITCKERKKLINLLTDFRISVKCSRPLDEAIITRGGVCLSEINPKTMESKKVRGLFFCGEVIDIDGNTGGYNLQAAFSTANLAALSAYKR